MQTYFISDGLLVKIGKSFDPRQRLASLQTSHHSPLTLLLIIDGDCEKKLHQQFADDRRRGEWFIFSPAIRVFITETKPIERLPQPISTPETLVEAQQAAEVALRLFPTLNANGFAVTRNGQPDTNYALFAHPQSACELATAIGFLRKCSPSKTQKQNSYTLKHVAEHWGEANSLSSYVSNGKLIAAAAYLEFPIKPIGEQNPNADIGISRRDVDHVLLDLRKKQNNLRMAY